MNVTVTETGAVISGTPPNTVAFTEDAATTTLTVATEDDDADEADSVVTATVAAGTGYAVGSPGFATVTIVDDDAPEVTIAAVTNPVTEGTAAEFTLTRTATGTALTVNVTVTEDGAVISGTPPNTVAFTEDAATTTLTVATEDDTADEDDSAVTATVTAGTGYAVGSPGSATVTVTDDDDPEPTLSIADAEGAEDEGVAFTVTLSATSTADVTATWTASIGSGDTADAADLTATTMDMVTVAAGDTTATFTVPVADDATDEADETFTVTLSSASNATLSATASTATGTITDDDAVVKATQGWIARFGRTVTAQVLEAIEARLRAPRAAGMRATLAGQALPAGDAGGKAVANDNASRGDNASDRVPRADARDREAMTTIGDLVAHAGAGDWRGDRTGGRYRSRAVTGRELLTGTSFALTGGSADSGDFAGVWGRGTLSRFEGRAGALTLDGEVATGLVGADWAAGPGSGAGRWMAGLAVGHSRGAGGYREDGCTAGSCAGEAEATLTGAWPYAGLVLSDRLSAWAAAGHGAGELRLMPGGNSGPFTADLTMTMGAAGLRGEVLTPPPEGGLALAVKGDTRFTRTRSKATRDAGGSPLPAATGDVWLLRPASRARGASRPATMARAWC